MRKFITAIGLFAFMLALSFGPAGVHSPVLADDAIAGRAGRAEVRFLEGMMDHHQMALDMANDCLVRASTNELLALCQDIIDAQSSEITTLHGWLLDWYNVDYTSASMMGDDMDMGGMVMGDAPLTDPTMMMGMMAGLSRAEGVDYDIAFLESMIDHHDDAIHMSERILNWNIHPETLAIADTIIADQMAETETMEALLVTLTPA